MNEVERKIINTFKVSVELYNMVKNNDTAYSDGNIQGMKEMAKVFGYVLYAHHKNDLVGLEYDYVSIAKDGTVLAEIPV